MSLRQLTRQRLLHGGGVGGPEVGRDVAAAERVDRLLGVADQHHRRVPGEGPVEHLPLHRVGVLELVDQHDAPPLPHPLGGGTVGVGEGVGELGEQVVVGQDPEPALAPVELVADGAGEADPATDGRRPVLVGGLERGLRVTDRGAGDGERLGVAEGRTVGVERERRAGRGRRRSP